ncbi:MAG: uracil phosphoribosyltransferase [Terrimicrobiaceae bacterium]|nr:uracil phosphoribosyltransferase [Terrimicrobiaceae bacterium]
MSESGGVTLVDHPLVQVGISKLRDRETPTETFRRILRELAVLVGVEAARGIELRATRVETPLAPCAGAEFARPIVILPILRAGLGMAEALLTLFPAACVGHVGLYRDETTFEPKSYYFKTPGLDEAEVFLVDPMLATGQSGADAVDRVKAAGAQRIRMVAIIGSEPGIEHFRNRHPDVHVFLAAIDPSLNDKAYIVPGLGDAGDRYFGT